MGDICHRIFRADGTLVRGEFDDRIIAIPVEDLLRIPRRVGIAGGPRKLEAIHGALVGRLGHGARDRPAARRRASSSADRERRAGVSGASGRCELAIDCGAGA